MRLDAQKVGSSIRERHLLLHYLNSTLQSTGKSLVVSDPEIVHLGFVNRVDLTEQVHVCTN